MTSIIFEIKTSTVQTRLLKTFFAKRISKAVVDILLIVGLILSIYSARSTEHSWFSFHCIVSILWYLLMLVHIGQHWQMTKALLKLKWKALKRNPMTFLTAILFILMTISIIPFMVEVSDQFVHIHHRIADIFKVAIVFHTITKAKQFLACFR